MPNAVLYVVTFGALVGLFLAAGLSAGYYHRLKRSRAATFFQTGERLAAENHRDAALGRLRTALQLAPDNREYGLALAQVLTGMDRWEEAEARVAEILQRDPTDAVANLTMARIRARQGQTEAATQFYHRAIYGLWPGDPSARRLAARFELVQLLQRQGARAQVAAELQMVKGELPEDAADKQRAAALFLAVGMPREAAELYRDATRNAARDQAAWAGLGEAEYLLAAYTDAAAALRHAVALAPEDAAARARLESAEAILSLDPTTRRLSPSERARRARDLLARTLDALTLCSTPPAELVDNARRQLRRGTHADAFDTDIQLAEQLWQAHMERCPGIPQEEVLARVFARLAQ